MNETFELKKALLQTRMSMHQSGFALAELQLKVLEEEEKASVAAEKDKPVEAELVEA